MACIVLGCKSHTSRRISNEQISFHRFPKNEAFRKKWLEAIRRPHYKLRKKTHMCSKHFTLDSFVPNVKIKRLNENALPTLCLPTIEKMKDRSTIKVWRVTSASHLLNVIKTGNPTSVEDEGNSSPDELFEYINAADSLLDVIKTENDAPIDDRGNSPPEVLPEYIEPGHTLHNGIETETLTSIEDQGNSSSPAELPENINVTDSLHNVITTETSAPIKVRTKSSLVELPSYITDDDLLQCVKRPSPMEVWEIKSPREPPKYYINKPNSQQNLVQTGNPTPVEDRGNSSPDELIEYINAADSLLDVIKTENDAPIEDRGNSSPEVLPEYIDPAHTLHNGIETENPTSIIDDQSNSSPAELPKNVCETDALHNVITTKRPSPIEVLERKSPREPPKYYINKPNLQQIVLHTDSHARCKAHEAIILKLEKRLERDRITSQRRLQKIKSLEKRNSYLLRKISELYSIINGEIDFSTIPGFSSCQNRS